jgi:DNA-binding CsgD family transcriptional regulator
MTHSLHTLFQAIAEARDEEALRLQVMQAMGEHFEAQCWGLCLLDEQAQGANVQVQGGPDASGFMKRYSTMGRAIDPVLRYVIEHHAPVHEGLVLSPDRWKASELYQTCYADYDHEHVMMGPIVSDGQLMGGIYFARPNDAPAFDFQDLAKLSGLCLHVSARLAALRQEVAGSAKRPPLKQLEGTLADHLTPREQEIAQLVAQGLTNAEIGAELWITQNTVKQALKRMFRKLKVSSRTELAARL